VWCQELPVEPSQSHATAPTQPDTAGRRTVLARAGDDHILVIDDDAQHTIHRRNLRAALSAVPVFSPEGTHAFFATEQGWLSKLDLQMLHTSAETHMGGRIRHIALSGNGKYLVIADDDTHRLTVLDSDLKPLKSLPITSRDGLRNSRVQSIHAVPSRQSFVVALRDIPEVWEISYNPAAPEIPLGVVHDFQYREGAFAPGFLNPVRTALPHPVEDFALGADGNSFVTTTPGTNEATLVHLDVRRAIARWTQPQRLRLDAAYTWRRQGHPVLAAPSLDGRSIVVIGLDDGQTILTIPVVGALERAFGHKSADHIWVLANSGLQTLTIIDKNTLKVVEHITAPSEASIRHVVFSHDGRQVYAEDTTGTVRIFDESSLTERRSATAAAHQ
jgi:DNA-binding beta-propeller fold protein YncE